MGGAAPEWAERLPRSTEAPGVEIVVVRAAPRDFGGWDDATPRLVIVDSDLAPQRFKGSGVLWLLSAPAADLDVIAEGCFRMACGGEIIGVDLTDAMAVAGGRTNALPVGRASVVPGMYGDSVRRAGRQALRAFVEDGFDGGIVLMQGVAKADEERFSLYNFDATASDIVNFDADCDRLLHAYVNAMTTSWTVIAFRKPDDPLSRRASDDL